jgi:hypothetical protein
MKNIIIKKSKFEKFMEGKITAADYIEYSICKKHGGKMKGLWSISTACTACELCRKRHGEGKISFKEAQKIIEAICICLFCYSFDMLKRYPSLKKKLEDNTKFYCYNNLEDKDIPFINCAFFRFEAFGDLINVQQFKNYCTIAKNNKHCTFTLFTKNSFIVKNAFEMYGIEKPENMIIIYSNSMMNTEKELEKVQEQYSFIDKVFNVYSPAAIEHYNKKVNCGARACAKCLKCYKKSENSDFNNLIEELKKS